MRRVVFGLVLVLSLPAVVRAQSPADDPRVKSALELLDVWIRAQVAYENLPGVSVAVVHDQDVIWSRGFGYADVEAKVPAAPDTIYSICSISKLFTSIGVMQLRDKGKLRLDDSPAAHLPWFRIRQQHEDSADITLRGILTHSSGLPREADFPYWTGPDHLFPTRDEIIAKVSAQDTLYPADTYYQYSNLGLTIAGEVVSAVSGQPYADYVQQHILDPLGLSDTAPELPDGSGAKRMATGYTAEYRDGTRKKVPSYLVRGIAPAAGFASTAEDLAAFASWQFRLREKGGTEVLDANTLKEMQRVHWLEEDWSTARGLGFAVSRYQDTTLVGHGGSCPGFRTELTTLPADRIALIFMTNAQGVNTGDYVRRMFDVVVPPLREAVENPGKGKASQEELDRYTGLYARGLGGETQVLQMNGELAMLSLPTDDPADAITKLRHIENHTFRRVRDDGELAEAVTFEMGPDGRAARFTQNSNIAVRMEQAH